MRMPQTPKVERRFFFKKKEKPDLLRHLALFDDYFTEGVDDIISLGFNPIFTYLEQMDNNKKEGDETAAQAIGILHALLTNARQNLERFFLDLDKHLGDPSIIRRKFGNWEHPEHEAIGVELIQRTPSMGKSLADLIPLVEAARKRGHDVNAVLRDLVEKDPEEVPT